MEPKVLRPDGYLDVGNSGEDFDGQIITSQNAIYHPQLNVIIVFGSFNQVKVLDVNSGVVLQTYRLESTASVNGRYMPLQEKLLLWDGFVLGFRGDYNGVLLLDTILQTPIQHNDELIRLEMLLSEATIFQTCLKDLEQEGLECPSDVSNELQEKIRIAQTCVKRGIKAQRWNTICLEVSYSSLKQVANSVVTLLKRLDRHIPALAIASAVNERLTDLLAGSRLQDLNWQGNNSQRLLMHSEAIRRQTFEKWPHMDYKWALPDQMAQAGFYHQPSSSGGDRAMCFTCSVCLVCWEKTDEPWSEHERHSPTCPFVKGEYTQNVPLSLTYATGPALRSPGRKFDVISNSDYANVLCTSCSETGDITVWSIERQLRKMHTFNVATLIKDICDDGVEWARVTAICVLPNERAKDKLSVMYSTQSGYGGGSGSVAIQCSSTSTMRAGVVGSKIILGLSIRQSTGEHSLGMLVLNIVESEKTLIDELSLGGIGSQKNTQNNGNSDDDMNGSKKGQSDGVIKNTTSVGENNSTSLESNGIPNDILSTNMKNGTSSNPTDQQITNLVQLEEFLTESKTEIKMDLCNLQDLSLLLTNTDENLPALASSSIALDCDQVIMDPTYFKEKLLAAVQAAKQKASNNNDSDEPASKIVLLSEEIDCITESCTTVKRMNTFSHGEGGPLEIVEITEIVPTNEHCNQLVVKLEKTKASYEESSQIIMNTILDTEEETIEDCSNMDSDAVAAQLLVFDITDSVISNEYTLAKTFNRDKCPKQMCMLAHVKLDDNKTNENSANTEALCVTCADGTIEIYSLMDFQPIVKIQEDGEHFVSVVYCRSLERLCGCTRRGSLMFYSLNDAENDCDEDLLDADEDSNFPLTPTKTPIAGLSVTDGTNECKNVAPGSTSMPTADSSSTEGASLQPPNIKIDCDSSTNAINSNLSASPSPSGTGNLLAYKGGELSLEDLRTLYALTQFDENLVLYTAEVPSCWNDMGQGQKHRKQSQYTRTGDESLYTKSWRLHNDTTTWDEHIIELNLSQPVNLGHIDMKFSFYQPCPNPAAIQVTLLKQNNTGIGYRVKNVHPHYINPLSEKNDIQPSCSNVEYTNENPVLNEEYLQAHNAEILAGPVELASCVDLSDQGGVLILTSPKLFKSRSRNFLLHIKTTADPSKEGQNKTRVPVKKAGPPQYKYTPHKVIKFKLTNAPTKTSLSAPFSTSKEPPSSNDCYIGCDWLHEISISVHGVRIQQRIPNERLQRIAMLESNVLLENLFKIVSSDQTSTLAKNLSLDILLWICFIRLNRFRSPKSERIKDQINKENAAAHPDLMAQQFECICLSEKYLENMLRYCIIRSDRSMAHKCVKLMLMLTDGICNLPNEIQSISTLEFAIKDAIAQTFHELPISKYASVVRWYTMLACATATPESHNYISELCVKLLKDIAEEINVRWEPCGALLGTRFGLYGFPFEPDIFDYDLPNVTKNNVSLSSTLVNMIRSAGGTVPVSSLDIKKLCSIDGVDFRTFPHLIKCKSVSNQLRGLLEVQQLHFSCVATSEATRIDNLDNVINVGNNGNMNFEDLLVGPAAQVYDGFQEESNKLNNIVYNIQNMVADNTMPKLTTKKKDGGIEFKANGVGTSYSPDYNNQPNNNGFASVSGVDKVKLGYGNVMPKFKAICQYIDSYDENFAASSSSNANPSEMKVYSKMKQLMNMKNQLQAQMEASPKHQKHAKKSSKPLKQPQQPQAVQQAAHNAIQEVMKQKFLKQHEQIKQQILLAHQQQHQQELGPSGPSGPPPPPPPPPPPSQSQHHEKHYHENLESLQQKRQQIATELEERSQSREKSITDDDNSNADATNVLPWHKLLVPPPKQMIVIDRMHSGARRFVVLDFGSPVLLTDVCIPPCEDLGSLYIDVWCFSEETDSVRVVSAHDIGSKTLVLNDLQPPPICRYMKITIIGRVGMSSTKCKIPIGSFYGHAVVLENDGYGDMLLRCMKPSAQSIKLQIEALNSLYEDVHCRYSLASCKLMELLTPILDSELSNLAHMQAFIQKQREEEGNAVDSAKVLSLYEECNLLQYQINVIRNVIKRLESALSPPSANKSVLENSLKSASRDKLRILSQSLIEVLLHFSIEYGIKNTQPVHLLFTQNVASMLFESLVVYGDAHIQLATCSLLVRMCCYQQWWGDFIADIFNNFFSSQNSKIYPQDRIFFLLTYLGRRSIATGACRSIVIDAVLKMLAKLLAPIQPRNQDGNDDIKNLNGRPACDLWIKTDLHLITWVLLFLSVCLDDNHDRKDKSANRWDFMSCETDFTKSRSQCVNNSGKQLRCFKKRILQSKQLNSQPYTDWGKKIFMIQNEVVKQHPGIYMEITGKPKPSKSSKPNNTPKLVRDLIQAENNFEKGLKSINLNNILVVIRGLIALLLEMDFNCNMDQFLLTCKVIARTVSACRPSIQLSKIVTTAQLEQLVRLAVWTDQQQPWVVHAITCLLQDLLDADKQYKDKNDTTPTNEMIRPLEIPTDQNVMLPDPNQHFIFRQGSSAYQQTVFMNETPYVDDPKSSYLPSLIEIDDNEFDDILNDIDTMERSKSVLKKDSGGCTVNKNTFNYFCRSISNAMDARLDTGLDINLEVQLRRLTMIPSWDMYSSLPQILVTELIHTSCESGFWPDFITDGWSGPEYNSGMNTYKMFKDVFDSIFADLHLEDTWVHLEQVLQMWLTLNGELSEKSSNSNFMQSEPARIPFGANAVQGLLLALAWRNDIKLRTWCLGFQCLYLACNSQANSESDVDLIGINEVIINDDNFEKMLLRFFSGYGLSSSIIANRCAGPTICKHLNEFLFWLHKKGESTDSSVISCKRKLKNILLRVVLQLLQPSGAISNQMGPIDAQSQLVRDLLAMPNDKMDANVALNIIEHISFLVYNYLSNGDKLQCHRTGDCTTNSSVNNLFANVIASDNAKHSASLSDNSLVINLVKLASSLAQMELPRQPSEVPIPEEEELVTESQTDETKAEQLNVDGHKTKIPCVADIVLRHLPIMKRLLGSLSHCSNTTFNPVYLANKPENHLAMTAPQTAADAVYFMLSTLCAKATNLRLIITPICQFLKGSTLHRGQLPRLNLSEPSVWYISKILDMPNAVQIFTQLGGIEIICQNIVNLNKVLINLQPGLISLIMQHISKNVKLKVSPQNVNNTGKRPISTVGGTTQKVSHEGLINFAPYSTITTENETAQAADILVMNPVGSHRRPRSPAWTYMFYPNESYVDLNIALPTAILLREVQLQPHGPTLASCPSAISLEISRNFSMNSMPVGPPLITSGMTCIRLKLSKPEIVTSLTLRLYRPKDSANIGLTQIAVLGQTIFGQNLNAMGSNNNNNMNATKSNLASDLFNDDDAFAKTSVGWIRILSRCFNAVSASSDLKLAGDVIGASASYPGFLEATCSLMNIMQLIPNGAHHNLEMVLFKIGSYNRELSLSLIKTLLWGTIPQTYRLSNENVCDLLYELATAKDRFTLSRIQVLLEWVVNLKQSYGGRSYFCTNPQCGFVKCIASILWFVYEENQVSHLAEYITLEVFEACFDWIDFNDHEGPLKLAFDSLLCSLCYIKPEFFNRLLLKANLNLKQSAEHSNVGSDMRTGDGLTDDNKGEGASAWFAKVATEDLSILLSKPAYLSTLAMACQSPITVYQLVDSGLPKLLAHALYEYCSALSVLANSFESPTGNSEKKDIEEPTTSASAIQNNQPASGDRISGLTDADKAESGGDALHGLSLEEPLRICADVSTILDFFSECCAIGHMRDWLGNKQGSIFWKPLLELLCNYRPMQFVHEELLQDAFIHIERAAINFFASICTCHPKNQETLTELLISVIENPISSGMKKSISGFTRQIVLQLLLENERILVSVRSKRPLQRKDRHFLNNSSLVNGVNGVSLSLANNHPSKRVSSHHLLFNVSTNSKCHDILSLCSLAGNDDEMMACSTPLERGIENINRMRKDFAKYVLEQELFNSLEYKNLESLSVAAGVTAKDKRFKDARNQAAANKDIKELSPNYEIFKMEEITERLENPECPSVLITNDATISQLLAAFNRKGISLSTPCLTFNLLQFEQAAKAKDVEYLVAANCEPLPTPLQLFSKGGGLSLLAQYLPTVYSETSSRKTPIVVSEKEKSPPMTDWVKLEPNDEIYEDLEDPLTEPVIKQSTVSSVPQHSLAAFSLFLRLPAYSDVLLRDKLRAQCLLRLVLGVTGDGEGNDIYSLSLAPTLPTLPFEVFRQLLDNSPLTTDDGLLLRRKVIEVGAMHLVLNCLSIFTHQSQNTRFSSPHNEVPVDNINIKPSSNGEEMPATTSDDKSHIYWAKGTGFGTGSTAQSWNVEQALLRQKSEEEHVTVLLQVLSSYINPGDKIPSSAISSDIMAYNERCDVSAELPMIFHSLLQQSCLIPALSSYLRNDSVLDITRHIPLYRAILQLLRALALSPQLISLLQPKKSGESLPIISLLAKMKTCVDTYAKRLKVNKKSNIKGQTQQVTVNLDDGDDEGLALLIPDIQETAVLVQKTIELDNANNQRVLGQDSDSLINVDKPLSKSIEERYMDVMKKLQFDTFDIIVEADNNGIRFTVPYHFEKMMRMSNDRYHPARVKRLAQEAVTLSTSLPLSYSSSVFVRCDTDRLDVMKVLITGPSDTPYANGCFEFDVYFPPDYPNQPMMINLETTGRHSVRFNPNLYNDGKVCLSVLNTWHGRPEEKWNAQTSSFLQVLVSIQSLILVPEPYFNEPGFERSRGTQSGTQSSREYNSNIYQACVRWAMLEQVRTPSACFKDVIHTHFWLKRNEICSQIEGWIEELCKSQFNERNNSRAITFNSMVLRRQYRNLREEFAKLKVPEGLEDLDEPFNPNSSLPAMSECNVSNADGNSLPNTVTSYGGTLIIQPGTPLGTQESGNESSTTSTSGASEKPVDYSFDSDAPYLKSQTKYDMTTLMSPISSPSGSDSTPVPLLVEPDEGFNDLSDATALIPPEPLVSVTAKITVESTEMSESQPDDDLVSDAGTNTDFFIETNPQMLDGMEVDVDVEVELDEDDDSQYEDNIV